LLTGVLALVLLVVPTTVDRISLTTSTYLCSGYANCQAAGYGHAGYRQAASTSYWRMYTGHNCTNYVAYRLIQSGMPDVRPWEGNGNASNWGVAMASITDQTPTVGSIAWYKSNVSPAGSNGHVAYVEQVISDTEIIVSEDYWGGDFHWRRVTKSGGGWPSGFIHFNDRVVAPTTAPAIVGTPAVGAPLEVAAGAWTPTPSSITVRWLADGAAIPGATTATYVPTPDVKGKALTAEVTAELSGYSAGRAVLATAPVAPGRFQPTVLPTIQGVAEVGQTLTLTPPSWSPQPKRFKTQWYADGVAVPEATGASLVLTRAHLKKSISARTVASASGYKKSRSTAAATTPVLAKPVAITSPSRVKGTPVVGQKLVARAGATKPGNATATYAWFRDGQRIARTTKPTYTRGSRPHPVRPGHPVPTALPQHHGLGHRRSRDDQARGEGAHRRHAQAGRGGRSRTRSRSTEAGRGDDCQRRRPHPRGPGRRWIGAGRPARPPSRRETGGGALRGDRRREACRRALDRHGPEGRQAVTPRLGQPSPSTNRGPCARQSFRPTEEGQR
jgi:surface antigen